MPGYSCSYRALKPVAYGKFTLMLKLIARSEYRPFGFVLILGLAAAFIFLTNIETPPDKTFFSVVLTGEFKNLEHYYVERFNFETRTLTLSRHPVKACTKVPKFESLRKITVVERYHKHLRYARIANIRVQVGSHTFYTYDVYLHANKNTVI